MTKEDKQTIYNLLRTASQNVYGYTTHVFESDEFVDNGKWKIENGELKTGNENNPGQNGSFSNTNLQPVHSDSSKSEPISLQPIVNSQLSIVNSMSVSPAQEPVTPQLSAPAAMETSGMSLGDVILKIARCTRCSLARTRTNVVPGQGSKSAEVLVIGDGPAMEDDASGVPFSGAAGLLMDKMLNAVKLDRRQNCFLTNIVKCTPPQNRDPYPEETDACFGFIEAQIKIIKPKLILCSGRVAAVSLLKNNPKVNLSLPVDQLRGQWFDYNGIPVMVVYSPAEVLKNPALKKPIWDDLRAFATKLKELSPTYAALFNS